jgi:hypothetical protein
VDAFVFGDKVDAELNLRLDRLRRGGILFDSGNYQGNLDVANADPINGYLAVVFAALYIFYGVHML